MPKETEREELALRALSGLLEDPEPRILHGSKTSSGIFPGASAKDKAAARICLDNRWLEPTGAAVGKGKTKKDLYRLSASGLQMLLARSDPSSLLQSLNESLARLNQKTENLVPAIQNKITNLNQEIRDHLDKVVQGIQEKMKEAFDPLANLQGSLHVLKTSLAQALERVKPVNVEELARKMVGSGPPQTPALSGEKTGKQDWLEEVVRMVAEQKQRTAFQRLTLTQLFDKLRVGRPDLTLGQFHDGLRKLQDEKRLRLGPYTQALATLDDPRNALYLDREVKYYAELP